MLRKRGKNVQEATNGMAGLSVAQKNELLFQNGINFNDLPQWQKRGCAIYWETFDLEAINPITKKPVTAQRRRLKRNLELPMKDEYSQFLRVGLREAKMLGDSLSSCTPSPGRLTSTLHLRWQITRHGIAEDGGRRGDTLRGTDGFGFNGCARRRVA
jgi:hypothetical protein